MHFFPIRERSFYGRNCTQCLSYGHIMKSRNLTFKFIEFRNTPWYSKHRELIQPVIFRNTPCFSETHRVIQKHTVLFRNTPCYSETHRVIQKHTVLSQAQRVHSTSHFLYREINSAQYHFRSTGFCSSLIEKKINRFL